MIDLSIKCPDYIITTPYGVAELFILQLEKAKFTGILSDNNGLHSVVGQKDGGLDFSTNLFADNNSFPVLTEDNRKYNFSYRGEDIPTGIEVEGRIEVIGENRNFVARIKKEI